MSVYLGIDVLDQDTHDMRDSIRHALTRKGSLLGSGVGRRVWDDDVGQAMPLRNFTWTATDRAGIAAMRSFIAARRGRFRSFWTPSYGAEIPLAADASAGSLTLVIRFVGYTRSMFGVVARRYLAVVRPSRTFFVVKVVAAVDNGDGTESLTLSATLPEAVPATRLVSWFALCRLDADMVPIRWLNTQLAIGEFPFREIPLEAPA